MIRLVSAVAVTLLWVSPAAAQSEPAKSDSVDKKQRSALPASKPARLSTRGGVYQHNLVETTPPRGRAVKKVTIDNRLGDVRIVGHDGRGVSIYAIKHGPDEETLSRLQVHYVHNPGSPVRITTSMLAGKESRPVPAGTVRVDLIVRAPRAAKVEAEGWNGRVEVTGFDNGAALSTHGGAIDVRSVSGQVTAESAKGEQSHSQIYGSLDARSLAGKLDFNTVRGKRLDAVSQRGDISGDNIAVRHISIRSMRGNIDVRAAAVAGGSYRIVSYYGDVKVMLSSKVPLKITAVSDKLELPKRFRPVKTASRRVTGYLGDGASPAHIDIRSSTGSVKLVDFD